MGFWKKLRRWFGELSAPTEFLCDSCRYNYPTACHRPERPNAKRCPDFKRK